MIVTSTELQRNFGKYIEIMKNETVVFTKNGKIVGKLVSTAEDKAAAFERLEKSKRDLHDVNEREKLQGRDAEFGE